MRASENLIVELSFQFALKIIKYCETLNKHRKYILANQLLKSGTSIGANIREAQNAESKADFIHKFKIAAKEIEETEYWLALCEQSENYPKSIDLIDDLKIVSRIVNKIIITSKKYNES